VNASVPPTGQPPAPAASGAAGTGTVVQLPPPPPGGTAPALQLHQALQGVVVARTPQGQVTVQTPLGPISVQTMLTPPPGAQVTLQVVSLGPPPQVSISPASGRSAGMPGQTATGGGGMPGAATGAAAAATPGRPVVMSLTQGALLQATVSQPAGASGAATAPGAMTQAGVPAGAANPVQAAGGAAVPAQTAAGGSPATGLAIDPALLVQGARLSVRLVGVSAPGTTPTNVTAGTVAATVTGTNGAGQTVVQSPLGQLALATDTVPPRGTTLLLRPDGPPLPPLADRAAAQGLDVPLSSRWEALRDVVQALQAVAPAAVQQAALRAIPQPSPQVAVSILMFVNALRGGTLRSWLGEDAIKSLSQSRKPLLDRLSGDFAQLQRMSAEPSSPEWRTYLVPLLSEGEVDQLKLHVRDRETDGGEESEDGNEQGDRFIVEANFTRLGPLQIDGLVYGKQLELMIRSHRDLGETARREISALYADAVTALGLTGSVNFQVTDQFVTPSKQEDGQDDRPGLLV